MQPHMLASNKVRQSRYLAVAPEQQTNQTAQCENKQHDSSHSASTMEGSQRKKREDTISRNVFEKQDDEESVKTIT